jgi:chromosome segregation ATPase
MGKIFETDFETIKQVIAPILREKDERAENAESQAKQQTSLLESCRKALVKAEAEIVRWRGDYPAIWEYEERLLARVEKAEARVAELIAAISKYEQAHPNQELIPVFLRERYLAKKEATR